MSVKVLVADDSPTIRRRATSTLGDAGYEVTCVEDSEAAWGQLEKGGPFDILLCDILMPGMDGYDLCHRVKAHPTLSRLPVLLLRGTFEPWDQARAEAAGADGFITKPFDADALLSTLREVLAGAGASGASGASDAAHAAVPAPRTEEPLGGSPFGDVEDVVNTAVFAPDEPLHVGEATSEMPVATAAMMEAEPLTAFAVADEPPPLAARPPAPAPAPIVAAAPPPPPVVVAPPPAPARAEPPRPPAPQAPPAAPAGQVPEIDDAFLDRIAERVVQRLSTEILERIAWEVVPDVAEALVRKRLLEIEGAVADD
jgi:CheY-like chemotaxis protein